MAETRSEEERAFFPQRLTLLGGREAVAGLERAICPDALTRDPAVAEGLALAGARAASMGGAASRAGGGLAIAGASCVHHVEDGAGPRGAFELTAASVQEAVDHCLAAHLLSRSLARAGICRLDRSLADRLSLVELPGSALIRSLLESEMDSAEPDAAGDRIVELARVALRLVGERTGRPADVIRCDGCGEAELLLVASGASVAAAGDVARALEEAGLRSGVLAVTLRRPFPEAALRDALAGAHTVFAVTEGTDVDSLWAELRSVAPEKAAIHALDTGAPQEMLERVAACLPTGVSAASRRAEPTALPSRKLAVAPAGPWAEEMARELAAAAGHLGSLHLGPRIRRRAGLAVLPWDPEAIPDAAGDLLLVADPGLLAHDEVLSAVRPGSTLLVVAAADSAEALLRVLAAQTRAALIERELRVWWLGLPESDELHDPEPPAMPSLLVVGAALAALCEPGAERTQGVVDAVGSRLEAAGRAQDALALRSGAEKVQRLDAAILDPERHPVEIDFRPVSELPRMPAREDDAAERARWSVRIQRFHLGRERAGVAPHLPIRPAALGGLAETLRGRSPQPFVLVRNQDEGEPVLVRSLHDLLAEETAALQQAGRPARSLSDNLGPLCALAERELAGRSADVDLDELLAAAELRLVGDLQLAEEEEALLTEDLAGLRGRLPTGAVALDVRAETPLRLYLEVLDAVREPLRERFVQQINALAEKLRDLLQLDRMASGEGRAPEALSAALGETATTYLDPEALSRTLAGPTPSAVLEEGRRGRIRDALARLESHLEQGAAIPHAIWLQPPSAQLAPAGQVVHEHPDPLAAAVGLFDGMARRMAAVFQAVRVARLEVEGRYRPEVHDEALAEFGWQAFRSDELALLPAVVALTTGRRLRQRDQGSLSELLRSSRPLHVIVRDEVGEDDEAEDLSRFHLDLGHWVIAHREAFAIGTTLARPERTVQGLARMVRAPRPGVLLAQLPTGDPASLRPLRAEAALHGRACVDFRYDPDAGSSWADRFDIEGNPALEQPWPIQAIRCLEGEAEQTLELALTFADAVALEPAYRPHFRLIPPVAWDQSQIPLAEYLDRFDPEALEPVIPFVWVISDDGTLQRAIVTRELALASRDHLRSWRVLQELAGHENVFAARAADAARDRALAEAETRTAEIERAHLEELERVRSQGARESMERLAASLIGGDGLPSLLSQLPVPAAPAAPGPASTEPAREVAESSVLPEAAEEEQEEALSFDEPYIDAPLCTTCNECTVLNPLLFQYNADKQAFIADAAAGTFAELVKAAELCPVHCIHPGKPRSGDTTATAELLERAAGFN